MNAHPLILAALLPLAAAVHAAPAAKTPTAMPAAKPPRAAPAAEPVRAVAPARDYNKLVLDAIRRMPSGGGYSVNSAATAKLVAATAVSKEAKSGLGLQPALAQPSYCSGATYLVFLEVVSDLVKTGRLKLTPEVLAMLPVTRQPDGAGVWGRWNANGPGTGRFFLEARVGASFEDLSKAREGDFLKIWWNEHVGKKERGHSVIFIRLEKTPEGEDGVRFWSSNDPDGMGEKTVPLTKVKRALVTRLEHPENLGQLTKIAPKDAFLASMLEVECSEEDYRKNVALPPLAAGAKPAPASLEKIVVHINGEPATPPAALPAGAANADAATAFMGGSPYAAYSAASKAGIIRMVQMRLFYDGFTTALPDGKPGTATATSLRKWQEAARIPATSVLDDQTQLAMGLKGLAEFKAVATAATPPDSAPARVPRRGE